MITLKGDFLTDDPRLDRIPLFDERSRNFAIAEVVPKSIKSKTWSLRAPALDQGMEGACVGFGTTHELLAYPAAVKGVDAKFARETIYWTAQKNDPWPGGSYPGASPEYEGTAVIEGVKAAQALGYYGEYRWAFSTDDICRAISHEGPVIVGTDWLEGMDSPDPKTGLVRATGSVRGGHCWLIRGLSLKARFGKPAFLFRNSWGPTWGVNGDGWMLVEDFAKLLAEGGEAVIPMRRSKRP